MVIVMDWNWSAILLFLEKAFYILTAFVSLKKILCSRELQIYFSGYEPLLLLQKIMVWVPAPMQQLTTICNSGPKKSDALLSPLWAPDTHALHFHTCR